MSSTGSRLKALRLAASPAPSVREMAALLGYGEVHNRYAYYEAPTYAKALPIDLARAIAAILAARSVEPAEVLALAGLSGNEAAGEAAALPAVTVVQMGVVFPSEDALTRMFETILRGEIPAPQVDALARILARQLPVALQRSLASPPVPVRGEAPAPGAIPPPRATRRPPARRESRT